MNTYENVTIVDCRQPNLVSVSVVSNRGDYFTERMGELAQQGLTMDDAYETVIQEMDEKGLERPHSIAHHSSEQENNEDVVYRTMLEIRETIDSMAGRPRVSILFTTGVGVGERNVPCVVYGSDELRIMREMRKPQHEETLIDVVERLLKAHSNRLRIEKTIESDGILQVRAVSSK